MPYGKWVERMSESDVHVSDQLKGLTHQERRRLLQRAKEAKLTRSAPRADSEIERVGREGKLPLSLSQQRLWFLSQFEGASEAYHVPGSIRLSGELDEVALRRALDGVVRRHEALRTRFEQEHGEPVQVIDGPERGLPLRVVDLREHPEGESALQALREEEAKKRFDLVKGPLVRGVLFRLDEREHELMVTMHHIVSDGWSVGVLLNEMSRLYEANVEGESEPLPELSVQYADYAVWQRQWLVGEELQRQSEYWQQALKGAPRLLELPSDRVRPLEQDYRGETLLVELGEELSRGVKALSRRHGVTEYMTLLAGWGALLSRLSGQSEVVIGSPVAGRSRVELEGLIGFFVNTLALRVELSGEPTVAELLSRVRGRVLQAQEHQELPFEQVVEVVQPPRSLSHTPLFQSMLAWQNAPGGTLRLKGLQLSGVEATAPNTRA